MGFLIKGLEPAFQGEIIAKFYPHKFSKLPLLQRKEYSIIINSAISGWQLAFRYVDRRRKNV
jgi:hypothetical protein